MTGAEQPQRRPDRLIIVLLAVTLLITVGGIVNQFTSIAGQQRIVDCLQAGYAELNSSTSAARAAGAKDRQAQRELLLSQAAGPGRAEEAISRFLAELDEADRTRDANPLPVRRCT